MRNWAYGKCLGDGIHECGEDPRWRVEFDGPDGEHRLAHTCDNHVVDHLYLDGASEVTALPWTEHPYDPGQGGEG